MFEEHDQESGHGRVQLEQCRATDTGFGPPGPSLMVISPDGLLHTEINGSVKPAEKRSRYV